MKWFKRSKNKYHKLPEIEDVSEEIPAVSEYLDAFRLPEAFKHFETDTLPVISLDGKIIGIVSEYDLAKIIPKWSLADDGYTKSLKVSEIMTQKVWTETEHTNIENILEKTPSMHTRVIPITSDEGIYTGLSITRTKLINYLTGRVKPQTMGGLATPIGVYLTDGLHQAGTKNLGLILTGMTFAVIATFIRMFSFYLETLYQLPEIFIAVIELSTFLIILKVSRFSKIHAAEHKTINAIERGLPLSIESVQMQSRVHKRCGTNLLVLVMGILLVMYLSNNLISEEELFLRFTFSLIGFLFIFSNWKRIGNLLQKYFTTSEPGIKDIKSGIKAGEELVMLHKRDVKNVYPTFLSKIWNMGFLQIITSFFLVTWLINKYILIFF